jgi:hypothetical protein
MNGALWNGTGQHVACEGCPSCRNGAVLHTQELGTYVGINPPKEWLNE